MLGFEPCCSLDVRRIGLRVCKLCRLHGGGAFRVGEIESVQGLVHWKCRAAGLKCNGFVKCGLRDKCC